MDKVVQSPAPKKEKANGVKCITFKKYTINKMLDWLTMVVVNPGTPQQSTYPLALHGTKARSRNKIVRILREEYESIEADRLALCDEFCEKDEEGKAKMTEAGTYVIPPENQVAFDDAFAKLMSEETTFDLLPSTQNDWMVVRVIILTELRTEMAFAESAMYEDVCVAFENM